MFNDAPQCQGNCGVARNILITPHSHTDVVFVSPIRQTFRLQLLQRAGCPFGNEARASQRFIKRLNLFPALREHAQRVISDEPEKAEIANECRMIVEQRLLSSAAEQPLRLVECRTHRPVGANDFNHRLNITLHPVNDAPIFFTHRNTSTFCFVTRHFGENRLLRLIQVGMDAA